MNILTAEIEKYITDFFNSFNVYDREPFGRIIMTHMLVNYIYGRDSKPHNWSDIDCGSYDINNLKVDSHDYEIFAIKHPEYNPDYPGCIIDWKDKPANPNDFRILFDDIWEDIGTIDTINIFLSGRVIPTVRQCCDYCYDGECFNFGKDNDNNKRLVKCPHITAYAQIRLHIANITWEHTYSYI